MFDFSSLIPIEYKNQRILTSEQLADGYGTSVQRIRQNFNSNICRYEEGKDYFKLTGNDLREFRALSLKTLSLEIPINLNVFYLWTESGALLHAKSLKTDQAWEMYKILMQIYFVTREQDWMTKFNIPRTYSGALLLSAELAEKNGILEAKIAEDIPKVHFYSNLVEADNGMLSIIIGKEFGMGTKRLHKILIETGFAYPNGCHLELSEAHRNVGCTTNGVSYCSNKSGGISLWTPDGRNEIDEWLLSFGYKMVCDVPNLMLV